jgi:hypothetical protein
LDNDPTAFNRAEADISHIVRDMFVRFKSSEIWVNHFESKKSFSQERTKSVYFFPKSNIPSVLELQKLSGNSLKSKESSIQLNEKKEPKRQISFGLLRMVTSKIPIGSPVNSRFSDIHAFSEIKQVLSEDIENEEEIEEEFESTDSKKTKLKSRFESLKRESTLDEIFHQSIINQDIELFLFLVYEKKVDVQMKLKKGKTTPLHEAVLIDNLEMVEVLIHEGGDVNSIDSSERSPLHFSCSNGSDDVTILLLGSGANINIRDSYGYSPLFLALKSHQFHLIPNLILFGGDINFKRGST